MCDSIIVSIIRRSSTDAIEHRNLSGIDPRPRVSDVEKRRGLLLSGSSCLQPRKDSDQADQLRHQTPAESPGILSCQEPCRSLL
ncbi:hypothetical protein PHSY_002764 [Pseudozyma hubeiensis SY62]|uniref:Uncharacterized protein n=1 Tax=Pseudozyma hubeiensis (strain SY62) TaxID=1305764 RepID=R9P1U9_PSEHS|nr:hypothetical protein PHSY_002764 [Pseudozyma hubeiensis SY62]GAC95189.1 hypothetical protein PHSY_002764 [Pseudozyma hubeiensis SY62]